MNKKAFSGLPNLYEDTKQTLEEWEKYIHKNELKTFIIFALYRLQSFLSIHVMMIYHIFVHNKPLLDFSCFVIIVFSFAHYAIFHDLNAP